MAWILGFSSTLSTTAFSGGFRYKPTTSAAFGPNSLSVLTHQPWWLPSFESIRPQTVVSTEAAHPPQVDSLAAQNTPDGVDAAVEFLCHCRPIPMRHAGRRRLLQQRQYPVAKSGVVDNRLARSRLVPQSSQSPQCEAPAPLRNGGDGDPQLPRYLPDLLAFQASQNNSGTLHGASLHNPALGDGNQTPLVFG